MSCKRLCDVANDGLCMGVCAMGIDTQGFKLMEKGESVVLVHQTLNSALAVFKKSEDVIVVQNVKQFISRNKNTGE